MNNRIIFREAVVGDIAAMSGIRLSVTENVLSNPGKITEKMYRDYLGIVGKSWVAQLDGSVVGFCCADKDKSSIWALFVHSNHEGKGAATGLLKLAVDWLFGQGNESIKLSTGPQTRADRFYAKQGWRREEIEGAIEVQYELHSKLV